LVQKVDKYGRKVDKQDNTMAKFYQIEGDDEGEKKANKYYDEEGKFKWEAQSSSEEEELDREDEEESEDEEDVAINEEEDDESIIWSEGESVEQEQSGDQGVQVGKRLALTNMDWDNLNATDILSLFSSFCKGDMFIKKVEIYPSLFGLEQMKKDTLYGPPKELFAEGDAEKSKKKKKQIALDEDENIDE